MRKLENERMRELVNGVCLSWRDEAVPQKLNKI